MDYSTTIQGTPLRESDWEHIPKLAFRSGLDQPALSINSMNEFTGRIAVLMYGRALVGGLA